MPPMDAIQRQAIHELAKFYLIDTDSVSLVLVSVSNYVRPE